MAATIMQVSWIRYVTAVCKKRQNNYCLFRKWTPRSRHAVLTPSLQGSVYAAAPSLAKQSVKLVCIL